MLGPYSQVRPSHPRNAPPAPLALVQRRHPIARARRLPPMQRRKHLRQIRPVPLWGRRLYIQPDLKLRGRSQCVRHSAVSITELAISQGGKVARVHRGLDFPSWHGAF